MKFSRETSMKVRTAIKVKLAELGNDVYEELPDYIMVMVANKKSEEQMTEDLTLFLGDKTDRFTSWLHSLLSKLQSIVSESVGENRASVKSPGATAHTPSDSGSEHSGSHFNEDASYEDPSYEDASCATPSGGNDEASTSNVHSADETGGQESSSAAVDADSTSKPTTPTSSFVSDVESSNVQDDKDTNNEQTVQKRKTESETRTDKVKVCKMDLSTANSKKIVKRSSSTQKAKSKSKTVKTKSKRTDTDSNANSKSVKSNTNAEMTNGKSKAGCAVSSSVKKAELEVEKDGESSTGNGDDPSTEDVVEDKSKNKIIRIKRL